MELLDMEMLPTQSVLVMNKKEEYKILNNDSLIFQGTNLKVNDILNIPTREYDGCIVTGFDSNDNPIFNFLISFYKTKFFGYDIANLI